MKKQLLPLLVIAVVLVGAAVFMTHRNRPRHVSADAERALVPNLENTLASGEVRSIAITRGEEAVTLALDDDRWVVRELFDYPVDFARLQRALLGLARVTVGQALPAATLDPAETVQVVWKGVAGEPLGTVQLGQTRTAPPSDEDGPWGGAPGGRFVRRSADGPVFLVRESLGELVARPSSWVDSRLLSVPAMDVHSVRIEHPDGEVIELAKADGELTLRDLAEGETFNTSKRHGVGNALSFLRFEEIADPTLDPSVTGLDEPVRYQVTTIFGQVYEVLVGAAPEGRTQRYARVQVTLPPVDPEVVPEDESDAQAADRQRRESDREELERKTVEENERLAPWIFLLPSHSADNMTQRRSALIKVQPPGEAPPPADAPDAPAPAGEVPEAADEDAPEDAPEYAVEDAL